MRCYRGAGSGPPSADGRPVSVLTHNVFFDHTDAMVPGVVGLALMRSYNSLNASRGITSGFGLGWTHTFEKRIAPFESRSLTFRDGDGVPTYYEDRDQDGTYQAVLPASERSWVVREADGSYVRHLLVGASETYDTSGRLTALIDPSGNQTSLSRDSSGRLVSVADPGGRTLTFTYDQDRIASASGPEGLIATYTYRSNRFLEGVTYADGSGYVIEYGLNNLVERVKDLTGRTLERHTYVGGLVTSELEDGLEKLTFSRDAFNGEARVTDAFGTETAYSWQNVAGLRVVTKMTGPCSSCGGSGSETQEWSYDGKGRVTSHRDGEGNESRYEYDGEGNLASETNAEGETTRYTYDERGRVLTRLGPDGSETISTYGPSGPLSITEKVSSGSARTTRFTYSPNGKLETVTDPRGKVTVFAYNAAGDLESVRDPLGNTTTYFYDPLERRRTVTDPLGNTTTLDYTVRALLSRLTSPDGTHSEYGYDLGARRTSVTDPLRRKTEYAYDTYGRLEEVLDAMPIPGVTRYGYDFMGNLTALTDAKDQTTSFAYDEHHRLSSVVFPPGGSEAPREAFTYDRAGRLETRTDRNGVVTTFTYDRAGRLTQKSYSDGTPAVTYSYDSGGRLATASNGSDSLSWTYDLAGQLLSETSSANATTVSYSYDEAGNRKEVLLNGTAYLRSSYDAAGRLVNLSSQPSPGEPWRTFFFFYDRAGRRIALLYPNGAVTAYAYDSLSRLKATVALRVPLTFAAYQYDGAGNRTLKGTESYSEAYSYDALDRLTDVLRTGTLSEKYGYDEVGNRTSSLNSSSWAYDERNQLLSDGQASFDYDRNGNLISRTDSSGSWTFEWNAENQLTRVLQSGAEVARFVYDPLGRRIAKIAGGVTRKYVYDGLDILQETAGADVVRYAHGPGVDEPLASERPGGASQYYHADGLGSVVLLTDASRAPFWRYRYDSFGGIEVGGALGGFSFTGREWDTETGLYYYRARYYDPKAGRFLAEDPLRPWTRALFRPQPPGLAPAQQPDINAYPYVSNNPTGIIDPTGQLSWSDWWNSPFRKTWTWGKRAYCLAKFEQCARKVSASCCARYPNGSSAQLGLFTFNRETCTTFGDSCCDDQFFKCLIPFSATLGLTNWDKCSD